MPAPDITPQDRQHAYMQLAEQLQQLGKSAAQAGDMAKKVEMAAYNKAANQAHYVQLWQTSLRKAQNAIQGAQQQQAQQAQQQQAQMAAQQRAQLAAQQQQLAAQQQQLAAQQQQLAAQQQAQQHQQAQLAAQQQAQRAALLQHQRQQQAAQQQAQAQQYAAQQGAMPALQQPYMGAPQQQPQQVVQQAPQQMQYVQVPPQQAQQGMQYVRQPGAQQPMQYVQVQQPGGQPQYVQVQQPGGQPQYMQAQQQYAPQPAGGHAMAPQYMQQARGVQQGVPGSLQAQVAHVQQQQQQQYAQPAAIGVPQHMAGRMQPAAAPQGGMPPATAMQQQPGMEQGFPAPAAGGMMAHAVQYDAQQAQQAQQQPLPAASTTASSAPQPGAGAPRRQLVHEEAALQEFLRLHAAFNEPRSKALNIRDSEGMLRWYADLAKRDPSQANKLGTHIKKTEAILKLLKSERPAEEFAIKESVRQAVKAFLMELKHFKDHLKRNAAKLAAAQQAGVAANGAGVGGVSASSPASAPASAGYLGMMDSDKMDGSLGSAKLSAGTGSLPTPSSQLAPGAAKPAPARPPAAPGTAASVAAEAARQQALARQRQAAGAEQQRRAAAAAAAPGPPLPADPMQRLLAVAQQPCSQGEAAAVRSGFQRLQRALKAEEQRQLAAQVADVPTPPLPPEAQRLVARERAALEAAAAAAGAAACSPGARGVVSTPCGQGFVKEEAQAAAAGAVAVKQEPGAAVAVKQEPGAAAAVKVEGEPDAKRARSASPDPFLAAGAPAAVVADAGGGAGAQHAQQAQRQRSELERHVASECEEAAAALGGAVAMRTAPDSLESGCVAVACLPAAAQQQARESGIKHSWQLLTLRVPPGYPEQPPTAVFPRASCSTANATQATAAAVQAQLAAAAAEGFVARLAALPPPQRLLPLAQAWLEATGEVSARLAARQAALE